MNDFEFPTNIKQIGSIGDGMRIYMEDYVYTYLQQYAEAGGYEERVAMLIGRHMVIDGSSVLFISGAVQGMYSTVEKGITIFSEPSMNYVYEQMHRYFRGLEIVGWMQSQPGYGTMLNTNYAAYHANSFVKPHQVMFVMDPAEGLNVFYVWDEENEELAETKGYFIYYDKNRGMHEYMLATRPVKLAREHERKDVPEDEPEDSGEQIEEIPIKIIRPKISYGSKSLPPLTESRRVVNLLVSLSAVLVLVCFIMGAGLIQNEGRISSLESQLTSLSTSYRDLILQLRDGTTESVFAAQGDSDTTKQSAQLITENGNEVASAEAPAAVTPAPAVTPTPVTPTPVVTPQPTPEPTPQPTTQPVTSYNVPDTYIVEKGDSLNYISQRFYGTTDMVEKIMELNGMSDADTLYYGKSIKLPQ